MKTVAEGMTLVVTLPFVAELVSRLGEPWTLRNWSGNR